MQCEESLSQDFGVKIVPVMPPAQSRKQGKRSIETYVGSQPTDVTIHIRPFPEEVIRCGLGSYIVDESQRDATFLSRSETSMREVRDVTQPYTEEVKKHVDQ